MVRPCQVCHYKGNYRSLNILWHSLYTCPSSVKAAAYKCVVHPILEYTSPVWYLHSPGDIKQLESVQRRAARWACGSRWNPICNHWSRSSDYCIRKSTEVAFITSETNLLHYLSTTQHLESIANLKFQYFSSVNRHSTNPSAIDISTSTINPYRYSFFISSPFLWNSIPANILWI